MSDPISFELNGEIVEALVGETIWQVADRLGIEIPHLCWQPEKDYRAGGNCRACMVEVEGERTLTASCVRTPTPGMKVQTASKRAKKSRDMVFELLIADQPERATSHDPDSKFWNWVDQMEIEDVSRFPAADRPVADLTHAAIAVNLDACINCNLRPGMPRSSGKRRHRHGLPRSRLQSHIRFRRWYGRIDLRCLRRMRPSLSYWRSDERHPAG